jgi:hypothetical protein
MAQAVFPPDPVNALMEEELLLQRPEVKKMMDMDRAMVDVLSRTDLQPGKCFREYIKLFMCFHMLREDIPSIHVR